jgi:hypothetical protein
MRWENLRTDSFRFLLCFSLCAPVAWAQAPSSPAAAVAAPPISADDVIKNLQEKNHERAEALRQFQSTRVYRLEYRGFPSDHEADMVVKMDYQSPGKKEFTVISQHGSKFIIDHVFKKLLEGEQEAANGENQRRTALTSENYDFKMLWYENGQYELQVIPKSKNKYLYRGEIWVDGKDFAVTHIQAEPAKNPSFWIKKTDIEHKYTKVDDFWLPAENRTVSEVRLGGRATLTINYQDYKITEAVPLNNLRRAGETTAAARALSAQPTRVIGSPTE